MSEAGKGAERVHRAAEREHVGAPTDDKRRKSDSDAAAAHPALTNPDLRKGHPSNDRRDKPVDQERDKDLKEGGIEGAARKTRGS
jgi:hypothetical protein